MAKVAMKFSLYEGYDGGEDKWRLDTTAGRFTASGSLSEDDVIKAFKANEFTDSGYKTGDGRPVFTLKPKAKGESREFKAEDTVNVSAAVSKFYKIKLSYKSLIEDEDSDDDDDKE